MHPLGMHSAAIYRKWNKGIRRKIGVHFSLTASIPQEVGSWQQLNDANIGVATGIHLIYLQLKGGTTDQGLQLLYFKIYHNVCAKAIPSRASSQPMMVQQGYQHRPAPGRPRTSLTENWFEDFPMALVNFLDTVEPSLALFFTWGQT